jgi:hypothetical protein
MAPFLPVSRDRAVPNSGVECCVSLARPKQPNPPAGRPTRQSIAQKRFPKMQ